MDGIVVWMNSLLRSHEARNNISSSNPFETANNFSLVPRRERHKALIGSTDQRFCFVFTFQRLGALFSDESSGFEPTPLFAFQISAE